MSERLKAIGRWLGLGIMIVVLASVVYIVFTDLGGMAGQNTGAGEIWWTDAPEVNEAYKSIKSRTQH
jgi:hypothetical protein